MMQFGLLGKTLGHSYSPAIHEHLGSSPYCLFEKQPEELADFLKNGEFHGINVTIPYKKEVIPYCNELTDIARNLGAVNTIVRRSDGTLLGHNTDYFGFLYMVQKSGLQVSGKKVLVLGTGGASVTAQAALKSLGAQVIVISRSGPNHYGNLDIHGDASVIVNTTPVGMFPNTGISPIDLNLFPKLEGVLDVIYNPARTQLLLDAEKRGIVAMNGLWMLVAQAKESAEYFLNHSINDDRICEIHSNLKHQMENIILIGMPGSGKSTIGKLLAESLGRKFVDADKEITEYSGKTIPELFELGGEPYFREIETQVLTNLGKQSGLVIATGGGCVTTSENYNLLHQNGTIIWIKRNLDVLPTDGRPLSQNGKLQEMYEIRKPLYEAFSDAVVINDSDPVNTVNKIIRLEKDV